MTMCNNCIHKAVCGKFRATGGVKKCEHHKEERKGKWVYRSITPDEDGNLQANCSVCGAGEKHASSMVGKVPFCWKCGADMRGAEDGEE